VSGDEPVTSPDQHRRTVSPRLARFGAIATILILLAMTYGNHQGRVEDIWLYSLAGLILFVLILDFVLRRNGLRGE
jgi:hypothetical protein